MPIVYSLIARGTTVFCEHTGDRGNFQQITRTILEKVDNSATPSASIEQRLVELNSMKEKGLITEEEFQAMRKKALDL